MAIISKAKLTISGHVQGVFYRQTACTKAKSLGLAGWVRNTDDGCVEMEVSGDRALVEKLIAWCKVGPPQAKVSQVYIDWLDSVKETSAKQGDFQILF